MFHAQARQHCISLQNPYRYCKPTYSLHFTPKISTQQRQYYKSRIRSVIAQNPQISQAALRERLVAEGLPLDRKYLGSLPDAIQIERARREHVGAQ
jgi:hypothetical protein